MTTDNEGTMNIVLVNASFDETGKFECCLNGKTKIYEISADGEYLNAEQETVDTGTMVKIDNIAPWGYVILTNKLI